VNIDTQLHLQTELSVAARGLYGLTGTFAGKTVPYIYINAYVKHTRGSEQHKNSGILFNVL